jgi:hypothetical protein
MDKLVDAIYGLRSNSSVVISTISQNSLKYFLNQVKNKERLKFNIWSVFRSEKWSLRKVGIDTHLSDILGYK